MTIRVLIIARRPIRLDEFGFESDDEIDVVQFAHRVNSLKQLADDADVAIVDVDFPEGAAFRQIASTVARLPDLRILALTASPPLHDHVARAIGAGAAGFVDVEADRQHHTRGQEEADHPPEHEADAVRLRCAGEQHENHRDDRDRADRHPDRKPEDVTYRRTYRDLPARRSAYRAVRRSAPWAQLPGLIRPHRPSCGPKP